MGEAESSTPRTTAEAPLKASKDKNCPFCGQAFTSSSLGRHLDLYIRPKNPKAPDGIHLVDEIRKLRGGITRRQAKGSVSAPKRDDSAGGSGSCTPANKKQSIDSEGSSMLVESPEGDDDALDVGKSRAHFEDVSWGNGSHQPARLGTKTPDMRRDVSRQLQKQDLDQRHKMSEDAEVASATEMALRELLKSVREARQVPPPPTPASHANPTAVPKHQAPVSSTSTPTPSTSPPSASTSFPPPPLSSPPPHSQPPSHGPSPRPARSSSMP